MKVAVILLCLYILQVALILCLEFRRPQRALAWITLSLCFPPAGLAAYYFLGADYWRGRRIRRGSPGGCRGLRPELRAKIHAVAGVSECGNPQLEGHEHLLRLLTGLSEYPLTGGNTCRVLGDGEEAYNAMLEAMECAREHIHIQFYIFRGDEAGEQFQDVMIRKARQGIKVRLLCDGLGSLKLERSFVRALRQAGVEVHFFLRPLSGLASRRFNYRNHRKIVVVDGTVGFTGGLNVGKEYLGKDPQTGAWRDTHVRIVGDAVYSLQDVFLRDWQLAAGNAKGHPRLFPQHSGKGAEPVLIIPSGPDRAVDATPALFTAAIGAARQRIWIASPYFIPDPAICRALKNAVLGGTDVRIMIPGKPDSELVYQASLSYVENLQDAGVKFYRYTAGFMHAKVMVIDGLFATVGSANLDMRSCYSNFELTTVLFDPERINSLAEDFSRDLKHSEFIDPQIFMKRGWKVKLIQGLCQLFSPLL
ncbi:cardiolipin synthase [Paenibacillus tengchongensis]|uniref:cardiolipin synthase n=1 Tax=Paenibacillus tengchongensis TaxID=2608684 RepID=UPI00124CED63|nr:cardiolipin synthase [Paenibacillus tengchongensis]